jgi:hypothetical protein
LLPLLLLLLLPSKFPSSSPRLTFFCPTTFGLSLGLENQDETKATKLCHFQRNRLEELAAPSSAPFVKLCPELPWFKIIGNHSTPETNFTSMQRNKSKNNTQTNKQDKEWNHWRSGSKSFTRLLSTAEKTRKQQRETRNRSP